MRLPLWKRIILTIAVIPFGVFAMLLVLFVGGEFKE